MVESIKSIKDSILEQLEQDVQEKGPSRIDPKMVDMVKDLAEAEKACWEAEYYMSVTEAMDEGAGYEMGYAQGGQGGSQGGGQGYRRGGSGYRREGGSGYRREGGSGYRRGYRGQRRDSMGRYTSRRGYREAYGRDDVMQDVRMMMQEADPQEKEQLKQQLRQMTQEM